MPTNKPKITDRVTEGRQKNKNGRPMGRKRLPNFSGDTSDNQLASIGVQLLGNLTEDNRKKLRKKASFLTRIINKTLKVLQGIHGRSYNEKLGIFVDNTRAKEVEAYAKLKHEEIVKPVRRVEVANELTRRQKVEKATPQKSPITHPFELELLKEDLLTKGHWYATDHVQALTDKPVPAGGTQLSAYIKNNKYERPLTFSYLKIPNSNDNSLNHFVSIHVDQARNEITYVDPVGDKISQEDQLRLQKTFPNAKICYLDENGKKLDQKAGERSPENILRVQYDGNSCGPYSAELTRALIAASENNVQIEQEIDRIKRMNPNAQRKNHAKDLKIVYRKVMETSQTPLLTKPRKPRGR